MVEKSQLTNYLKRVGSLLVMGEDGETVKRVADGIQSDPEDVVKSVSVWKLYGGSIVLDYNSGESLYPLGHKLPASYEPVKVARRGGFIFIVTLQGSFTFFQKNIIVTCHSLSFVLLFPQPHTAFINQRCNICLCALPAENNRGLLAPMHAKPFHSALLYGKRTKALAEIPPAADVITSVYF